jgi:hypothetical protein
MRARRRRSGGATYERSRRPASTPCGPGSTGHPASRRNSDLRDRYQAVKTIVPSHIVTSHAAGVGLFASPHHWEGQADDWTMARQVDFYGTSFYPKHSAFVDRDVQVARGAARLHALVRLRREAAGVLGR